jgi:ATP-dependent exoDNAse (exonuclease V) beta subunit
MTKEEYLAKLNEAFHDFRFFPDDHHYEYKGKRVGISVTRLIEEYTQPFDAETVAQRVAKKSGKSVQEVLDEWQQKNELSCKKGSQCHEFVQSLWSGEEYLWNGYQNELCSYDEFSNVCDYIFEQAHQFHEDYKDKLEHLAEEFVIGSEEYDVASAIDHLFINTLTGGLVLVDYKTNSDIHKKEKYAGKMKAPLSSLKDTTLNHYYIQLSIYKYLVEKYAGVKVDEMFIVYMSENIENYEIIDVPYLKKEVETILEWRKYE